MLWFSTNVLSPYSLLLLTLFVPAFLETYTLANTVDGKHTVFGNVAKESFETLQRIEECAEVFERDAKERARITKTCTIIDCGQL